jgi:protein O-mannosyl-transferase
MNNQTTVTQRRGLGIFKDPLLCIGLIAITIISYLPIFSAGFIWDDEGHVPRPDMVNGEGLKQIWLNWTYTQQYYPVLNSFFWLQYQCFKYTPLGYHSVNLVLHILIALLLVIAVKKLLAGRVSEESASLTAWLSAVLFAIHPVGVETVAWISEQKNTLSTVFYLVALIVFFQFQKKRSLGLYVSATCLFILAILSKSVTVTLPISILLISLWRDGYRNIKHDLLALLPWIVVGCTVGLGTAWLETHHVGAQGSAFELNFLERFILAGRIIWFYVAKLLWPSELMFIYPRWHIDYSQWYGIALVSVLLITLIYYRNRIPSIVLCVFGFGVSLFPALGFFNVYPFVFSYVADHFQYLASLWLFVLCAGFITACYSKLKINLRIFGYLFFVLLLSFLGWKTYAYSKTFSNLDILYKSTLAKNPEAWLAHDNLGVELAKAGKITEAIEQYQLAIKYNPNYAHSHNNLANAYAKLGMWENAEKEYSKALEIDSSFYETELNWGNSLADRQLYDLAITHYVRALKIHPSDAQIEYHLGSAYANLGNFIVAIEHFKAAIKYNPEFAEPEANLGLALVFIHQENLAWEHFDRAVKLNSYYPEAHGYWGAALAQIGRFSEALSQYKEALKINPNSAEFHYQAAQMLKQLGRYDESYAELMRAHELVLRH